MRKSADKNGTPPTALTHFPVRKQSPGPSKISTCRDAVVSYGRFYYNVFSSLHNNKSIVHDVEPPTKLHPESTATAEVITGKISDRCGRRDRGAPFSDTYRGRGLIFESSKRRFNFIFTPATRRYDETFIGGFHETRPRNINCGGAPRASSAPHPSASRLRGSPTNNAAAHPACQPRYMASTPQCIRNVFEKL